MGAQARGNAWSGPRTRVRRPPVDRSPDIARLRRGPHAEARQTMLRDGHRGRFDVRRGPALPRHCRRLRGDRHRRRVGLGAGDARSAVRTLSPPPAPHRALRSPRRLGRAPGVREAVPFGPRVTGRDHGHHRAVRPRTVFPSNKRLNPPRSMRLQARGRRGGLTPARRRPAVLSWGRTARHRRADPRRDPRDPVGTSGLRPRPERGRDRRGADGPLHRRGRGPPLAVSDLPGR
jgi:hypothetical protein